MKKSRLEILRGKLRRMGERDEVDPAMPDDVADAFLAELRFDPDEGAIAARAWRPDHRNEQPWIKGLLDSQPRAAAVTSRVAILSPHAARASDDGSDEPVN